ncbi:hypothetical protein ABK040_010611 [Willaertia magna]
MFEQQQQSTSTNNNNNNNTIIMKEEEENKETIQIESTNLHLPVQGKISCLFEISFNEEEKKVLATNQLNLKILKLFKNSSDNNNSYNYNTSEHSEKIKKNIKINPTIKIDGTCCLIRNGKLFKRFDRKLNQKGISKNKLYQKQLQQSLQSSSDNTNIEMNKNEILKFDILTDFKEGPNGWFPCDSLQYLFNNNINKENNTNKESSEEENEKNKSTIINSQHLVGWIPLNEKESSDRWHLSVLATKKNTNLENNSNIENKELYALTLIPKSFNKLTNKIKCEIKMISLKNLENQTVELIGSKINANPYKFPKNEKQHFLIPHGSISFLMNNDNSNNDDKVDCNDNCNDEKEVDNDCKEKDNKQVDKNNDGYGENGFLVNMKELTLDGLKKWFEENEFGKNEGIVFHILIDNKDDNNNNTIDNKEEKKDKKIMLVKIHRHHLNLKWPIDDPMFKFDESWMEEVQKLKESYDFLGQ